ncbi:hypothetical protein D9M72_485080 [compost metagenome]
MVIRSYLIQGSVELRIQAMRKRNIQMAFQLRIVEFFIDDAIKFRKLLASVFDNRICFFFFSSKHDSFLLF